MIIPLYQRSSLYTKYKNSEINYQTHVIRDKFREFLQSEEGRVGVKAPLAVDIAGGSLLLAQAMFPTDADAHLTCKDNDDCSPGEVCKDWEKWEWSPDIEAWILVKHSACEPDPNH